ncbi:hypothetical protein [Peribacillus sp. S4]
MSVANILAVIIALNDKDKEYISGILNYYFRITSSHLGTLITDFRE